ncbi:MULTISPECIES: hypothetical protein [Prochlorococcus]|nr:MULTISPECIES: hypothetical protein [Prochlorococcus]KGG12664.1 hypothetical protein EV05_1878 [Prochlorococcus sp. MIT 0601]
MEKDARSSLESALDESKSKGKERLTQALLQALEDHHRELKKSKAA